jgi:O-antigen/teichoic acid export membrane protein
LDRDSTEEEFSSPLIHNFVWNKIKRTWLCNHDSADFSTRRWRRIMQAATAGATGRIVSLACSLVQVPIALSHLGPDAFGLWMTLTSMVALANFADLGLGLGLQNLISRAHGRDAHEELATVFRTGFLLLTAIAALLLAVGLPILDHLNWAYLLNIPNGIPPSEASCAVQTILLMFGLGIPLTAFQRAAMGLQLGWIASVSASLGSAMSLFFVYLASRLDMKLIAFIVMGSIGPLLANFLIALLLRRYLAFFSLSYPIFDTRLVTGLFRSGIMFLIPQIGATLMNSAPVLILNSILGPTAVTPYVLAQRITSLVSQAAGMALTPLWPAYAEAYARGDIAWIKKTFRLSIKTTLLALPVPGLAFWFYGDVLIRLWSSYTGEIGFWFLGTMALWVSLTTIGQTYAVFLNGLGRLRGQAIYGSTFVAAALFLVGPLTERLGLVGVPLGMSLSFILINLVCATFECLWVLRNLAFPKKSPFDASFIS